MKLLVFSIFDRGVQAFMQPFFCRAKGEALRSFSTAVNDEKSPFHRHAADYHLAYLGEFDDSAGVFVTVNPERIVSASEVIEEDVPPSLDGPLVRRMPM